MWRTLTIIALLLAVPVAQGEERRVLDVTIAERKIAGAENTLRVTEGDTVELRLSADEAVELHLHGYEIAVQVPAGGSAVMAFTADATGRFPISHHGFGADMGKAHGHRPLLYLEVHPK